MAGRGYDDDGPRPADVPVTNAERLARLRRWHRNYERQFERDLRLKGPGGYNPMFDLAALLFERFDP